MDIITRTHADTSVHISTIKPNGLYFSIFKTMIDTVFAAILLLFLSPAMFLISIKIRIESSGPVIFKQTRIGKDGKQFIIYKFRTMYKDVPAQGRSPVLQSDARITKTGRWLRKTSLDELPQLINILKGDMSFVGPRPEQEIFANQLLTEHEYRFTVKPGITGLWQISQCRHEPIIENMQYDFNYVRQVSFIVDIKIVFKTVLIMFRSNTI